jgi:hypothetical protein
MVRCSDLNDLVDTWEVRWPNYLNWFGWNPTISNWTVNYIHHFYFPTSFWYPNLAPLESIWPAWRNPFTVWIWRVDHVVPWKKRDEVYRSVYLFNLAFFGSFPHTSLSLNEQCTWPSWTCVSINRSRCSSRLLILTSQHLCFEYFAHFCSILVVKFGLSKCERVFRLVKIGRGLIPIIGVSLLN